MPHRNKVCRLELMLGLMSLFLKQQITQLPINLHLALSHVECGKNQNLCWWGNLVLKFAICLHAQNQDIQPTRKESSFSLFIASTTTVRFMGNRDQEKLSGIIYCDIFKQILCVCLSSWPFNYIWVTPFIWQKRIFQRGRLINVLLICKVIFYVCSSIIDWETGSKYSFLCQYFPSVRQRRNFTSDPTVCCRWLYWDSLWESQMGSAQSGCGRGRGGGVSHPRAGSKAA